MVPAALEILELLLNVVLVERDALRADRVDQQPLDPGVGRRLRVPPLAEVVEQPQQPLRVRAAVGVCAAVAWTDRAAPPVRAASGMQNNRLRLRLRLRAS